MESHWIEQAIKTAGLSGIAMIVFLILFRELIRRDIFPVLTKDQAYRIIKLFLVLASVVTVAAIAAWVFVLKPRTERSPVPSVKISPLNGYELADAGGQRSLDFPKGFKFEMALQNTSTTGFLLESFWISVDKCEKPTIVARTPMNFSKMKFGAMKPDYTINLTVDHCNVRGYWSHEDNNNSVKVEKIDNSVPNFLRKERNREFTFDIKPGETDKIIGAVNTAQDGVYVVRILLTCRWNGEPRRYCSKPITIRANVGVSAHFDGAAGKQGNHSDMLDLNLVCESGNGEARLESEPEPEPESGKSKPTMLISDRVSVGGRHYLKQCQADPSEIYKWYLKHPQRMAIMMVSDGNTNHVVNLDGFVTTSNGSKRICYCDSWGDSSFLEEGKNILGIKAKREKRGKFSLTQNEFEQVMLAILP